MRQSHFRLPVPDNKISCDKMNQKHRIKDYNNELIVYENSHSWLCTTCVLHAQNKGDVFLRKVNNVYFSGNKVQYVNKKQVYISVYT